METGVERLAALVLILTGLSHVAAPRTWARFFVALRERGDVAGLLNAAVHLPLGLTISAFHPVWSGAGLLVTLTGWALLFKGTLYLVYPALALRSMARVSEERAGSFRVAGVFSLLLGLAFAWIAWG